MPKYVSNDGVWTPAKEKVGITNAKGEPEVYEGPDRAALAEIKAGNIESKPFWKDTEFIARVRQVHNMTIEEYMKANGYDEKTSKAEFEKKLSEVNVHAEPSRKPGNRQRSGGQNTAGQSGHLEGDFGEPELKTKGK